MRITRPRATAFTQLTGVASAVQMATHIVAAIHGLDPTFTSLTLDAGAGGIKRDVDNSYLELIGGTSILKGASIQFQGESGNGNIYLIMGDRQAGHTPASVYRLYYQADGTSTIVYQIDKSGNVVTVGTVDGKDVGAMEPSGMITLWSGAISAIPTGWVLCDGANSTPNLTDRFVIHADADAAGTRNVGDTGGAMTHTNTIAETAAHTHTVAVNDGTTGAGAANSNAAGATFNTGSAGSGNAHAILNKFHALAYIMKT